MYNDLYIRGNKVIKGEWSMFDKVINHRQVIVGEYVLTLPVVKRMTNKEVIQMLFMGLVGAVGFYFLICAMIILAPCPTM